MAKLTLILIPVLSLFLLCPLSNSLPASDLNGGDVLLLPSDNSRAVPDTDSPAAVAVPKSAIAEPEHEPEGFVTVPLTKLDFHEGSMPLSLRFPHKRCFGRSCRHGFMRPREIPYGNDMILSNGMDRPEEFVGKSRFHWLNRRPRFEVAAPWKGEEDVFQRPKKFERGFDEEDMFKRPKKFRHHDDDDDDDHVFKQPKKFDHDDDDDWHKEKHRHEDDEEEGHHHQHHHRHHHEDDEEEGHHHRHHHEDDEEEGHHHKHHHDDDEEDGPHEHGKHHHHDDDDDDDDKSGILSKMRNFFDDLF